MRSTSKRRLDMSRVFHGLRPLVRVAFWQPPVPIDWMVSPCAGDLLFAPVHDAEPEADAEISNTSGCPICGELMLDVTSLFSATKQLLCVNPVCGKLEPDGVIVTVTVDPRARSRFAGDSAKPNGSDGGQR